MKKSRLLALVTFLSMVLVISFVRKDDKLKSITDYLERLNTEYPSEKVYLHFDKPYYSIGEDIWFKAYVVNAEKNELSAMSKVLYVDVIDRQDSIRKTMVLAVQNGTAAGSINLSDSLFQADTYQIRAYTKWMQNFDNDYFFHASVAVGDALNVGAKQSETVNSSTKKQGMDLQFFPEGGNMVYGLPSRVAFKAVGTDGLGKEVSGSITDQNGNHVAEISSEHLGMGSFTFTPEPGKEYSAVVRSANGFEQNVKLPMPMKDGHLFSVNTSGKESIRISVFTSSGLLDGRELTILAKCNGRIEYVSKIKTDRQAGILNVPKKYFGGGMVHFTLFSGDYIPLAERLVFIEPKDTVKVTIKSDKMVYSKRELVKMELKASSADGSPLVGTFSVSVTDQGKVAPDEDGRQNILSNLLLSSDLKGHIESPGYYFNTVNQKREKHLDLLLMTQGWSRYSWKQVRENSYPTIRYQAEQSISIGGRIISTLTGKPISNAKITLLAPRVLYMLDTISDAQGRFRFGDVQLAEGEKFVIRAKNEKDRKNVSIVLDTEPIPSIVKPNFPLIQAHNSFLSYLKDTRERFEQLEEFGMIAGGIKLKEVEIKQNRPPKIPNSVLKDEINVPDLTITEEKLRDRIDIADILRGKLMNKMKVEDNKVYGRNLTQNPFDPKDNGGSKPMLIVLDGNILDNLEQVDAASLSGIEIFAGGQLSDMLGYIYGRMNPASHYGIIVLTSRRTALPKTQRGMQQMISKGYAVPKEFYSPNYALTTEQPKVQDLRSTIYWNPNIITDRTGHADFNFYTADVSGVYCVIFEGISVDGNLFKNIYNFEIKP